MNSCLNCGKQLAKKKYGPSPKYCSANCRAAAGRNRAKADGREQQRRKATAEKRAAERAKNAKPCPYCGDPMLNPRRVQCGKPECKRRYTNDRNLAYQRKYKEQHGVYYAHTFKHERTCEACGKTWQASKSNARFCSTACANAAREYEHTCEECGVTWVSAYANRRFCSPECEKAARYTKEIQPWRRQPWWLRREPPASKPPRRWYAGQCQRCGAAFVCDQPESRYCSRQCRRLEGKLRRRAREKNARVAVVRRWEIFERDNWTCQLCGRKVNRNVTVPHPDAPVLDHVIPLDKHGPHVPDNVQCAHFMCNSIKGARVGDDLPLRSA